MTAGTSGGTRSVRLLFLTLVPCLFVQVAVRRYTEPYPAIFLPAGESLLRGHGRYTAHETTYVAEDVGGKEHPLSIAGVLDTVPTNYHAFVVKRGFGINEDRDVREVDIRLPWRKVTLRFGRPLTQPQIEQTRAWLRPKLRQALGVDAARVHILTFEITTFYEESPARRERRLLNRQTVELARGGS